MGRDYGEQGEVAMPSSVAFTNCLFSICFQHFFCRPFRCDLIPGFLFGLDQPLADLCRGSGASCRTAIRVNFRLGERAGGPGFRVGASELLPRLLCTTSNPSRSQPAHEVPSSWGSAPAHSQQVSSLRALGFQGSLAGGGRFPLARGVGRQLSRPCLAP